MHIANKNRRKETMPIITVSLVEGRSAEAKNRLIENITNAVESTLGVPRQSVRILISEISADHWGVGGVSKAILNQSKNGNI